MAVRWVEKKGGSLVGFRERKSSYVPEMTSCEVLPPRVSALIRPLRTLVDTLDMHGRIPQVEVAVGDELTVLVLRVLEPVEAEDGERLKRFAEDHGVQLWLQAPGPDSAQAVLPLDAPPLFYRLPHVHVAIAFWAHEFSHVN